MHNRTAGARRATAKSAYPSVASLPSPRRFASACRGLRPLKNAWPTASDVYQGRGKPRRRQPNHLELNQTYAPPEGSLRVGQYGSRRSDRLCSSWTTAAACKSVRVERQRGGGSAATGAASEPPESPTQRGSGQSGGKPTLAPETRPGGRRGPILAAATVQPWPGLAGPSGAAFDQGGHGGVVSIDITTCAHCGGAVRIVASIEEPTAIRAILAHFEKHGALEQAHYRPAARAPPPAA